MNIDRSFYNGKIGVVDLTLQTTYTTALPVDTLRDHIGGAAMNARLLSEYESDSIVLGTGPLTGSFAPASSLLVGTFRSTAFDHLCHVPCMLRSGPEMKFSGFDFLVIRGAAKEPCAVTLSRGQVRFSAVPDTSGRPVPELLRWLRQNTPMFRSCILTGSAADRNSPCPSVSIDGHGSLDRAGLASRMAAKNLKAILFNGIGGLPFHADHPALAAEMEKLLRSSGAAANRGFAAVVKRMGDGGEAARALRGKLGRNRACYHCPCPCMTYGHDRKAKTEERREAVLLMDHRGWAALSRKSEDAIALLKKCVELGLDSMGAGTHLGEDRPLQESLRTLEALASGNASFDAEDYPSAPGVDTKTYQIFGGGIPSLLPETAWTERVAAAMILGICPVFMQLAGRPDRSDLLRFLSSDAEEIQACSARIDEEARTLLEGNIPEQTLPD